MPQLSPDGQKILKMFHILFAVMWIGSGLAMITLMFLSAPANGSELYMRSYVLKIIDDFLLIPGAVGCLFTGLFYGLFTKWGFFRHRWLAVKWVMTVAQILFGTFVLGPWVNGNVEICRVLGEAAMSDPGLLHNLAMSKTWGTAQVALLLPYIVISVKKPWKGKAVRA